MIVLVTGRRVLMLHGGARGDGVKTSSAAEPRAHAEYGVVEWEIEFDLLVWLETDIDGNGGDGEEASNIPPGGASSSGQGRQENAHGSAGASVSVYHFPGLCLGGSRKEKEEGKHQTIEVFDKFLHFSAVHAGY